MIAAAMCYESGQQHGVLMKIIDEEPVLSRREMHVHEKGYIPIIGLAGKKCP